MSIIGLKKANCKNCYKCVKVCPVKSIKVVDEQAQIIDKDCILCGRCLSECPQNAKTMASDVDKVKNFIRSGKRVVLSLAPSYFGSFDFETPEKLVGAMKALGFWGVGETSEGAAYVTAEYHKLLKNQAADNIITTCCPVINDLVEKYYPDMLPYMAPVITPMIAHGRLMKETYGSDIKVVFAGPCIAKKGEKDDIRHDTQVDAVLTFAELAQWLDEEKIVIDEQQEQEMIGCDSEILRLYPLSGGILKTLKSYGDVSGYDLISVDGIEDCKELFESIRAGKVKNCFVEINACVGGCVNGPARLKKGHSRFEAKLEIEKYVKKKGSNYPELSHEIPMAKCFVKRSNEYPIPDEATIRSILMKIGKETPEQELNCGSCGYPSCRAKAIAVYQGKAELTMCMPFIKERAESLSNYVLSETPNITIIVDSELNIVEFNHAAEKKFNLTRREALQKCLYELIDTSDFQFVFETKESIHDKKVTYEEYNMTTLQDIIYIADNNFVMGIFKDITAEEQAKANMYQLRVDTVEMAQKVIEKQMVAAQQIASLLGETTAETKVTLTKLKNMIVYNGDEL